MPGFDYKTYVNYLYALGINSSFTLDDIKKAYLNACKMYHPDNVMSDEYIEQYNICQSAYDYLTSYYEEYVKSAAIIQSNMANNSYSSAKAVKRESKVIGKSGNYSYDHKSYIKKQSEYKKQAEEKKVRSLNEIIEKSRKESKRTRLEKVNYKSEDDILNQIRWLRVAKIIHDTIEADKLEKNKNS